MYYYTLAMFIIDVVLLFFGRARASDPPGMINRCGFRIMNGFGNGTIRLTESTLSVFAGKSVADNMHCGKRRGGGRIQR